MLIGEPRTQRQHEQQRRHQQRLHQQQRAVRQRKCLEHISADRTQRSQPPRRLAYPGRHDRARVLQVVAASWMARCRTTMPTAANKAREQC